MVVAHRRPGDALIVGDRVRTQPLALEAGVACLIVTGGLATGARGARRWPPRRAPRSRRRRATPTRRRASCRSRTPWATSWRPTRCTWAPTRCSSEAAEDLLGSHHREAHRASTTTASCVGILTRTNIARGHPSPVVLVDHNEASQSAAGIEEASVVEIVDHHRVGDIQTAGPILFLNLPVGSTATIVATRYATLGVEVPPAGRGHTARRRPHRHRAAEVAHDHAARPRGGRAACRRSPRSIRWSSGWSSSARARRARSSAPRGSFAPT